MSDSLTASKVGVKSELSLPDMYDEMHVSISEDGFPIDRHPNASRRSILSSELPSRDSATKERSIRIRQLVRDHFRSIYTTLGSPTYYDDLVAPPEHPAYPSDSITVKYTNHANDVFNSVYTIIGLPSSQDLVAPSEQPPSPSNRSALSVPSLSGRSMSRVENFNSVFTTVESPIQPEDPAQPSPSVPSPSLPTPSVPSPSLPSPSLPSPSLPSPSLPSLPSLPSKQQTSNPLMTS